jgi:hypothetical protein
MHGVCSKPAKTSHLISSKANRSVRIRQRRGGAQHTCGRSNAKSHCAKVRKSRVLHGTLRLALLEDRFDLRLRLGAFPLPLSGLSLLQDYHSSLRLI